MVFTPPPWVPNLPFDPPDSIPISQFMLDNNYRRRTLEEARPPFTCGLTGQTYSAVQVKQRVDYLARAIAREWGWGPNEGTAWDKVVGVFSVNTIDTVTVAWATHRLSGISTPANAAYSVEELVHQLKSSGSKALFTCLPLLDVAREAARKANIPQDRIYLFDLPKEATEGQEAPNGYKTVNQLIAEGERLPALEELKWEKGQGATQCAFLCYSSGTSGLPKGVMISHRNVIANCLQISTYDCRSRESDYLDVCLGLLPQSHIYALVVICHTSVLRGDEVIVLPRFEIKSYLSSIQRFKINTLYLVPPIIIAMAKNKPVLDKFDLKSVTSIFTGAAPLGVETAEELQKQYPSWKIRQGYGLTETSTVISSTSSHDIYLGSCGSLLPSVEAKLLTPEGNEVSGYGQRGELVVRSPSIVLGYLDNEAANRETFVDGWMRTGDEAMVRRNPASGIEHFFITDRIKELIKVKAHQVAPAELEAHLLTHPAVADAAVIPVPHEQAGEVPKAYVVKATGVGVVDNEALLKRDIARHVEMSKASYKWLVGGVEFIDVVPKSPSGKILRRLLRDKEKEARRKRGPKM